MFTVVIESEFKASHAVKMPDGSIENAHSHDWKLKTAVVSEKLDEFGFAVEFGQLQSAIKRVTDKFEGKDLNSLEMFENRFPTTEIIAEYLYNRIKDAVKDIVCLKYVKLTEAVGCSVRFED